MSRIGRVPFLLALQLLAVLSLAACDPKDLYGPEEGYPLPLDESFFPATLPTVGETEDMGAAIPSEAVPTEALLPGEE